VPFKAAARPAQVRVGPLTLEGPEGTVTLPGKRRTVVNVWLQGCGDCMPAFEAWKRLRPELPEVPIVNVAYGSAEPTWARTWSVDESLVFDGGSALVRPLGISSFTTFVLDEEGLVLFRGRPGADGYLDGVLGALGAPSTVRAAPAAAFFDSDLRFYVSDDAGNPLGMTPTNDRGVPVPAGIWFLRPDGFVEPRALRRELARGKVPGLILDGDERAALAILETLTDGSDLLQLRLRGQTATPRVIGLVKQLGALETLDVRGAPEALGSSLDALRRPGLRILTD
jgi:hypothetical protein